MGFEVSKLLGDRGRWVAPSAERGAIVADELARARREATALYTDVYTPSAESLAARTRTDLMPAATPNLDKMALDLTEEAKSGNLKPVNGRAEELTQLIGLLKDNKSAVLLGEAGVGKTALVEALAQRIVDGKVPPELANKRVLALDLDALTGGTKWRGDLEEKTKTMLEELRASKGQVVLFIDELHRASGQVSTDANDNLLERLKPDLTRNAFSVVGATTHDEFNRDIAKDPALERRFNPIKIDEPSKADTRQMLRSRMAQLEDQHGVKFQAGVVDTTLDLAERYLPDRRRPAGPLTLLDKAATLVALRADNGPGELRDLRSELSAIQDQRDSLQLQLEDPAVAPFARRKLEALDAREATVKGRLSTLESQVHQEQYLQAKLRDVYAAEQPIVQQAQEAADQGNHEKAHELLNDPAYRELKARGTALAAKLHAFDGQGGRLTGRTVTATDLSRAVEQITHVPVRSDAQQAEHLLGMNDFLKKRVVGQDHAADEVATAVQRAEAGMADPRRPRASFLFLGPTGVGKTEMVKGMAEFLLGDAQDMGRIDMSEFGGPMGNRDALVKKLTDEVRKKPFNVLLLDEVEKANPGVYDVLLQVLDEGHLSDAGGRQRNFKNTYVAMTSNLDAEHLQQYFRPEFLNRIGHVVNFDALDRTSMLQIVDKFLAGTRQKLEDQYIDLEVTPEARQHLAELGFDPAYGARPLQRAIADNLEGEVAQLELHGQLHRGDKLVVGFQDGHLTFDATGPGTLAASDAGAQATRLEEDPEYRAWLKAQPADPVQGGAATGEASSAPLPPPPGAVAQPAAAAVAEEASRVADTGAMARIKASLAKVSAHPLRDAYGKPHYGPLDAALGEIEAHSALSEDPIVKLIHDTAALAPQMNDTDATWGWTNRAAKRMSLFKTIQALSSAQGEGDARMRSVIHTLAQDAYDNPYLQQSSDIYTTATSNVTYQPLLATALQIKSLADRLSDRKTRKTLNELAGQIEAVAGGEWETRAAKARAYMATIADASAQ